MTITLRTVKGSELTHEELDGNFTDLDGRLTGKQATLVSGTNIKTVNGASLLGSGDQAIAGGATNLSYTASPTAGLVVSDTGTDATLPLADGTNAGLMAPAQVTKLAGVAEGATQNTVSNSLTDTSTTNALSAAQGKALKDAADALSTTVAGKQAKLGSAIAFTSRSLAGADDGQNLIVSTAQTATINTGLGAFGCTFLGPGAISFTAGAGVTFVDWRVAGAAFPSCCLVLIGTDSYAAIGGKA